MEKNKNIKFPCLYSYFKPTLSGFIYQDKLPEGGSTSNEKTREAIQLEPPQNFESRGKKEVDAALRRLESREQRVTEWLLKLATSYRRDAKQGADTKKNAEFLALARYYEEAAKEPLKPTKGQFFAYAERLYDMYSRYLMQEKALQRLIVAWEKKQGVSEDEKKKQIAQLEKQLEELDQEWERRMGRYADEKFGNGAQLEYAQRELIREYQDLIGGRLDAEEYEMTFNPPAYLVDYIHTFTRMITSQASYGRRPPGAKSLGESVYHFWNATKVVAKKRANKARKQE